MPSATTTAKPRLIRRAASRHTIAASSYDTAFGTSIGYQVRKTHRMTENYIQTKLSRYDISIGMWYFLRTLWIEDGVPQRELGLRAGATEPTTLEQVRKMEKRGLVERRRDDKDRRKILVLLTPEGRSLKGRLLRYVEELNDVSFRGFTVQETKQIGDLLHRLRGNLHAVQAQPKEK